MTCKNKESYDSALKLNGIELQNKPIVVVPYSLCEYTETLRLWYKYMLNISYLFFTISRLYLVIIIENPFLINA